MKRLLTSLLAVLALGLPVAAFAAPLQVNQGGTGSTTLSGLLKGNGTGAILTAILGTDYVKGSGTSGNCVQWGSANLLADAGAPCGSGSGSGIGTVATSGPDTAGRVAVFGTTNGYPAKTYAQATSSVTISAPLTTSGTQGFVLGGSSWAIGCQAASGSQAGCLSSADWTTFNGKENALTFNYPLSRSTNTISFSGLSTTSPWSVGQLAYVNSQNMLTSVATGTISAGSSAITVTAGRAAIGGALAIDCAAASGSQNGCLSSTDWTTFNNKGSGTVTSIATTWPISGGTISTTGTISWIGLATTSQPSSSNLLVSDGGKGIFGVATSTLTASSPLTGSFVQIGSSGSLGCQTASGSQAGCLSSTDWNTFNNKVNGVNLWAYLNSSISTTSPVGIYASTTIGNGTATGGLTVSGNATTTNLKVTGLGGTGFRCVDSNSLGLLLNVVSDCGTVTSVGLSDSNSTLTIGSTPVTTSGTITATLNLAHTNSWSVLQNFSNASTSLFSVFNTAYFGGTSTSTIVGNGATSTIKGTFVVASSSPNAFVVQDQYGTQDLRLSTASSTNNDPIFALIATSSSDTLFQVDQYGHLTASSTKATPAVACTPSGGTISKFSNDVIGVITGGTLSTSCTITFTSAYSIAPLVVPVAAVGGTTGVNVGTITTTSIIINFNSSVTGETVEYGPIFMP